MQPDNKPEKKGPACPQCGNRLRLRPDQQGEEVMCPKCGGKFVVGRSASTPAPVAARRPAPTRQSPAAPVAPAKLPPEDESDDAYEPEIPLARNWGVPEDQMVDISPKAFRETPYEARWRQASDPGPVEAEPETPSSIELEYLEVARAKGMLRDREEPKPTRWPFLSGVFDYAWRGVNLSRWTAMSFGLSCSGAVALAALQKLGFVAGDANPVLGILLGLFATLLLLGALSFSAASFEMAVSDTADGHALPQDDSLPEWDHWVFSLLGMLSLLAFGGALGYPLSLEVGPIACLVASLVTFPPLLLSALESQSYLLPYSPPVLRTLVRSPISWLKFYLLSTPLLAAWVVGFDAVASEMPYLAVLLSGPVVAALILIYGRLLGRLAWSITRTSGSVPRGAAQQPEPDVQRASRSAGQRRKRIVVPEPGEGAAASQAPAAAPRLDFHRKP